MNPASQSAPRPRLLQAMYAARRRAGLATERFAGRVTRLRHDPVAGLPQAACDFLGVPDGRTLQVHAVLPAGVESGADRAELLMVGKQRVLRYPATVRDHGDGRCSVAAMVRLGEGPGEVSLARGTWSVALAVSTAGRGERRFALRVDEPVADGPTVAAPPHPVSGRLHRPGRSGHGLGQLTVAEARARAEVVRLATGRVEARIRARLVGVRTLDDPAAVFTPRGGGPDVVVPIDPVGGVFELVVPLAELASGPMGEEVIWEAWVRTSTTRQIRLGRFLHDLRDPRTVLRVSRVTLPIGDDQFVGYRPYYTPNGNLAVACLRFARFTGTAS